MPISTVRDLDLSIDELKSIRDAEIPEIIFEHNQRYFYAYLLFRWD